MLEALWSRLLSALEGQVPAPRLESWLRPCRLVAVDGDRLRVLAPNKYTRDWIGQHHADTIEAAARRLLGASTQVSIEMDAEPEPSSTLSRERIPGARDELTPALHVRVLRGRQLQPVRAGGLPGGRRAAGDRL